MYNRPGTVQSLRSLAEPEIVETCFYDEGGDNSLRL